jgi:hypothetical protein
VEANAVSGETVGAGPLGTVLVVVFPAVTLTHTRFLETRRQANVVPLTIFVEPTFVHELVAALAELVGGTSGRESATRAETSSRFMAERIIAEY